MAKAKFGGFRNLGEGNSSSMEPLPPNSMADDDDILDADLILRSIGISDDYTNIMERTDVSQYLNEISRPDPSVSSGFHQTPLTSSDLLTIVSGTQETMLHRLASTRDLELTASSRLTPAAGQLASSTVAAAAVMAPQASACASGGIAAAGGARLVASPLSTTAANGSVFVPSFASSVSGGFGQPPSVFMVPAMLQQRPLKRSPSSTSTATTADDRPNNVVVLTPEACDNNDADDDAQMRVLCDASDLRRSNRENAPMQDRGEVEEEDLDSDAVLRNLLAADFQMQEESKPVLPKPEFFHSSVNSSHNNSKSDNLFSQSNAAAPTTLLAQSRAAAPTALGSQSGAAAPTALGSQSRAADPMHLCSQSSAAPTNVFSQSSPGPNPFSVSSSSSSGYKPFSVSSSSGSNPFSVSGSSGSGSPGSPFSHASVIMHSKRRMDETESKVVILPNQNLHQQKIRLELRPVEPPVFTMPSSLPPSSPTATPAEQMSSPATVWKQEQPPSPRTAENSPRHTPRPSPVSTPPPAVQQYEAPARGDARQWRRSGRSTPTGKRSRPQTPTSEGELSDGGYREREPHGWSTGRSTPVEVKPSTRLEDMVDEDKYNKRKRSTSDGERGKKDPIKAMLEQLQSHIPHIGNPDQEKVSHAGLLIEGSDYIRSLMRENKSTKENLEALKIKIEELNKEIETAQEKLPEHGSTAIHRILSTRGKSIPDMFADHVRQRTQEDWRYWVFTSIMGHFVHSFAQDVSNISPKEMERTTLDWIQERMSMQQLRKDAFRKLAKLCSKTSIMENPAILPDEARGFVALPDHQTAKEEIEEDPPAFRNKY